MGVGAGRERGEGMKYIYFFYKSESKSHGLVASKCILDIRGGSQNVSVGEPSTKPSEVLR